MRFFEKLVVAYFFWATLYSNNVPYVGLFYLKLPIERIDIRRKRFVTYCKSISDLIDCIYIYFARLFCFAYCLFICYFLTI